MAKYYLAAHVGTFKPSYFLRREFMQIWCIFVKKFLRYAVILIELACIGNTSTDISRQNSKEDAQALPVSTMLPVLPSSCSLFPKPMQNVFPKTSNLLTDISSKPPTVHLLSQTSSSCHYWSNFTVQLSITPTIKFKIPLRITYLGFQIDLLFIYLFFFSTICACTPCNILWCVWSTWQIQNMKWYMIHWLYLDFSEQKEIDINHTSRKMYLTRRAY